MYQLKFPLWLIRQGSSENPRYLVNQQGHLFAFTSSASASVPARNHPGSSLVLVSRENLAAILAELAIQGQESICCDPHPDETWGTYFSVRELASAVG